MSQRAAEDGSRADWRARAATAGLALAVLALAAGGVRAQGFRISGTSVADFVQLRPLVADSIPRASAGDTVPGSAGDLRYGPEGQIVRCLTPLPFCNFRRPASTVAGVPLTQDLQASVWGFTQGLRAYVHVRGRASTGDASKFWPQAEDAVDLLSAYLELDRGGWRARAGRQWHTSGLGYYDFDGAALLWRARRAVSLEGFAGLSLERGLFEPQTSAEISALEPFAPGKRAVLLGAEARWRPDPRLSTSAIYQRELRTDRKGLFSERAALNARGRLFGSTLDGQLVYDVAQTQVNEGRLRVQLPTWHSAALALEARHHEPFFELWTVWGAFSPVGFDEARALASWAPPDAGVQLSVGGGPRRYRDAGSSFPGYVLRRDGYRFTADAAWQARQTWAAQAAYAAEIGFGAARSDQSLALRRLFPRDGYAGLSLQAFQTAYEFRVEEGRVLGAGAEAGFALRDAARVDGNLYLLRHSDRNNISPDWGQVRGSLKLSWTLGREPGPRISGAGIGP